MLAAYSLDSSQSFVGTRSGMGHRWPATTLRAKSRGMLITAALAAIEVLATAPLTAKPALASSLLQSMLADFAHKYTASLSSLSVDFCKKWLSPELAAAEHMFESSPSQGCATQRGVSVCALTCFTVVCAAKAAALA